MCVCVCVCVCQSDADYIGRTFQRLKIRVEQLLPPELSKRPQNTTSGSSQLQKSAIGDHLANHYI